MIAAGFLLECIQPRRQWGCGDLKARIRERRQQRQKVHSQPTSGKLQPGQKCPDGQARTSGFRDDHSQSPFHLRSSLDTCIQPLAGFRSQIMARQGKQYDVRTGHSFRCPVGRCGIFQILEFPKAERKRQLRLKAGHHPAANFHRQVVSNGILVQHQEVAGIDAFQRKRFLY